MGSPLQLASSASAAMPLTAYTSAYLQKKQVGHGPRWHAAWTGTGSTNAEALTQYDEELQRGHGFR